MQTIKKQNKQTGKDNHRRMIKKDQFITEPGAVTLGKGI